MLLETLKELENAADEYACYVDKEELIKLMDYVEITNDGVVDCIENIEHHLAQRSEIESVCCLWQQASQDKRTQNYLQGKNIQV